MTQAGGFEDARPIARFGCGTVLSATDGNDYLLITDESTLRLS